MKVWHFTSTRLRDGRPLPKVGDPLRHMRSLLSCRRGLHGSREIRDALKYAPGPFVSYCELEGAEAQGYTDKLVGRTRTVLWRYDATDVLRAFARRCALDVISQWDAPDCCREFIKTGEKTPALADWSAQQTERALKEDQPVWDVALGIDSPEHFARTAARHAAGAAQETGGGVAWHAAMAAGSAMCADPLLWSEQNKTLERMIMGGRPEE